MTYCCYPFAPNTPIHTQACEWIGTSVVLVIAVIDDKRQYIAGWVNTLACPPRSLTKFFKVEVRIQMRLLEGNTPLDAGAAHQLHTLYTLSEPQVTLDNNGRPPACKHEGSQVRILTHQDIAGRTLHPNNICTMLILYYSIDQWHRL